VARTYIGLIALCACGRLGFTDDSPLGSARVQHGTLALTTELAGEVAIDPVDPAQSFLVFGVAVDTTDPGSGLLSGHLEPGGTVRFTRAVGAASLNAAFHVIEWPGISVQTGVYLRSTTESIASIPLEAVDPATAFPIVTTQNKSFAFSGNELQRARL